MILKGFVAMLPITTGVIPFGLVMGTVASHAQLSAHQTIGMNLLVFAGTSQLAVVELMLQKASSSIIIATGLIINLRFMLYSAAFAPYAQRSHWLTKIFCSYTLTDQTFTALKANLDLFKGDREVIEFYIGSAICMLTAWQGSVILGFVFGNILPTELSLDFAIPLSFVALVMPTFKNYKYVLVAIIASILSLLFKSMPYNIGLLSAALLSLGFATLLTRKTKFK